jgi:hypothetical protein
MSNIFDVKFGAVIKNWEEEGIYLPGHIRQNDGA